jgi:hypothetical protein
VVVWQLAMDTVTGSGWQQTQKRHKAKSGTQQQRRTLGLRYPETRKLGNERRAITKRGREQGVQGGTEEKGNERGRGGVRERRREKSSGRAKHSNTHNKRRSGCNNVPRHREGTRNSADVGLIKQTHGSATHLKSATST